MRVAAARELGHQAQQLLLLLRRQLVPELTHGNGVDPAPQCFEHLLDQRSDGSETYQARFTCTESVYSLLGTKLHLTSGVAAKHHAAAISSARATAT